MRFSFPFVLLLFALVSLANTSARERAPDWLTAVLAAPVTVPLKDAAAVVLLDNGLLEVAPDGTFTTRTRLVTRILTADGRKHASARLPYMTDGMKIKGFKAWIVRSSGDVVMIDKKQIIDTALHTTALELYGQARQQSINAPTEVEPGDVFAHEAVVEEKGVLGQRLWRFRGALPTQLSSFTLQLPPGWQAEAFPFNQAPAAVNASGRTQTWSLSSLPAIESEPMAPPQLSFVPWIALNLAPPPGAGKAGGRVAFHSWRDISVYFSSRYEAAAAWDPVMKARADALVGGATLLWDKMRALCQYAQQVNYISIQLDAANAGGMIPRPARRVFDCNYGDCKDKATLLRAMLASQGIAAYPLVVKAGSDLEIRESWASPAQFNHCILAIHIDDTVKADAVVNHPALGRLLIFDPTNEFTPVGLLADSQLAPQGILLGGEQGDLITLPAMRPEDNRMERQIKARLDTIGNITATIEERFFGHASAGARREHSRESEGDFLRRIQRWLSLKLPVSKVSRLETKDMFAEARFSLSADFASPGYGKLMRDELLVFKPAMLTQPGALRLRKAVRTQPLQLRPSAFSERSEIILPSDCTVDEKPAPVELKTAFGSFTARSTLQDKTLIYERSLDLHATEIPAADYEQVRSFFEKVLQAEQSPVVLRRR